MTVAPPDPSRFKLPAAVAPAVAGRRVFVTGSGKHHGLGQGFAYAAGLSGAASVAVHFNQSYEDALATVDAINAAGGNAFPVQADVTNPRDVWSMRSYCIKKAGGPPDLVICNSGRSEDGYLLGKAPKEKDDEAPAARRARVRQAFVKNLDQSRDVIDTKLDGFLAMTHLWSSEALHAGSELTIVYISSRQAHDPGAGVPGYCAANWAVLALPRILRVNLGKDAARVSAFSVGYPFVRTAMTEAYADNPKVFGRWQPRMLTTEEASTALFQLLLRPRAELNDHFFQLEVAPGDGGGGIQVRWSDVRLDPQVEPLAWSVADPLRFE
ncbi:MAG: SDR family oxidoreductase [Deltaproteobacteria bacterium]|nr:SDR family oxidoreductase [Deltaproteobacteria bacterium]